MKNVFSIIILISFSFLISCQTGDLQADAEQTTYSDLDYPVHVQTLTDNETGCQYIVIKTKSSEGGLAITPRIAADGKSSKGCKQR